MPFPLDDLLLPGEQKSLHLYEARFLALFEEAIKSHGGCIGQLGFFEEVRRARTPQCVHVLSPAPAHKLAHARAHTHTHTNTLPAHRGSWQRPLCCVK